MERSNPTRASTRMTGPAALMIAGAALFAATQETQAREAVYVYDVYYARNGQWVRWQSYFDPNDATRALQYLQSNYPKLPRTWGKRFWRWSEETQSVVNITGTWRCTHHSGTHTISGGNGSYGATVDGQGVTIAMQGNALALRFNSTGGTLRSTFVSANRITWSDGSSWYR